jgi:hypothetical protein
LIARSSVSRGTEALRALSTAAASRGLASGLGSPIFAATWISFTSLEIKAPRLFEAASRPECFHCAPMIPPDPALA